MNCLPRDTAAELERLEESLWRAETRYDSSYMDAVLHPDFQEIGRSGRVYTRAECIAITNGELSVDLPLRGYAGRLVAPSVVLATYVSVVHHDRVHHDGFRVANRSSLWVHDDIWRLRFHQGTPINLAASFEKPIADAARPR